MSFNSHIFLLAFLPLTLLGYFLLNRYTRFLFGKCWLIGMSLVFYAYANPYYLPVLVGSIFINTLLSRVLIGCENKGPRKLWLALGLVVNLGVLGYFKYANFFLDNVNALFGTDFVLHRLLLPMGISFFTFQQVAFLVDSYRGDVPAYGLVDYALFVTFFPQLTAGPIVLHKEMIPQFEAPENRHFNVENFSPGLFAFALGLAKKVLVADTFARVANYGFAPGTSLNTPEALFVVLAFTFQLYFDFSGYCDMALGIGKMFNFTLPVNFNSPYKSLNIQDFWNRWHITLGRFFRDYIYLPLGGSRKGTLRTCLNLMVVFLVSGLWHGASWMFLLWGALHGAMRVLYRLFRKQIDQLHPAFNWAITFSFVTLAWVFFRAETMEVAMHILRSLFRMDFGTVNPAIFAPFALPAYLRPGYTQVMALVWFLGSLLVCLGCKNTYELTAAFEPNWQRSAYCVVLLFVSIVSLSGVSVFLYANF